MALLKDSLITGDLRVTGTIYGLITNALKDGNGNTITSKYVTLDTAQTITGAKTITGNLTIGPGGGFLNGSATNGGCNTIRIGDDVWLGDVNAGGFLGMQAVNSGTPNCGFLFKNGPGTEIGRLYADGTNIVINKTFAPTATNSINLGTNDLKWANVYAATFHGDLDGIANKATLLNPISSTTTVGTSTWNIPSGSKQVWGQSFRDSSLTYTPSGGSATTITDTGDWTMWLTPNATSNAATLNMRIDGTYYGSFSGNVSGNASTATKLQTARTINGTNFDGSANITTANWGTARTLTIGSTGKSVNGSANVSWSVNEVIGARTLQADRIAIWDRINYSELNESSASYWGFSATTDVDGIQYNMNTLGRDKFISNYFTCQGGETFLIKGQISTSCKGNVTNGGTENEYRGTAIGIYTYKGDKVSTGILYSKRVTGSAEAPWTDITTYVTVSSAAKFFRVFVQTESWQNMTGNIKIRNIEVFKVAERAQNAIKATQDSDGNTITSTYVKKAGDTMTGALTVNGHIYLGNTTYGSCVDLWSDNEGGNILLRAAGSSGTASNTGYEFDVLSSNLRLYRTTNGGASATHSITLMDSNGNSTFIKAYGAVWNDYAEFRKTAEAQPGQCVREVGDGSLILTTKRLEKGCEIVSDTYGFAIGETDECKTPIATTGRVLAYPYEDIEEFKNHIGDPVCSGPNGTVSIMTEEEEEKYPSRIIGTISEIPTYETWGTGNVKVNKRVWIRIR